MYNCNARATTIEQHIPFQSQSSYFRESTIFKKKNLKKKSPAVKAGTPRSSRGEGGGEGGGGGGSRATDFWLRRPRLSPSGMAPRQRRRAFGVPAAPAPGGFAFGDSSAPPFGSATTAAVAEIVKAAILVGGEGEERESGGEEGRKGGEKVPKRPLELCPELCPDQFFNSCASSSKEARITSSSSPPSVAVAAAAEAEASKSLTCSSPPCANAESGSCPSLPLAPLLPHFCERQLLSLPVLKTPLPALKTTSPINCSHE